MMLLLRLGGDRRRPATETQRERRIAMHVFFAKSALYPRYWIETDITSKWHVREALGDSGRPLNARSGRRSHGMILS